jgi:CRISPR/Cas system CMR-associated protein Cmr1 (group 7 of RAMP superfamily)
MKYIILLCLVKFLTSFRNKYNFRLYCAHSIIKSPLSKDIYSGKDNRYNESDADQDLVERLKENLEKYKTLKYLENDRVSILDKLQKIGESGINALNLNAGGLMKDWDFII